MKWLKKYFKKKHVLERISEIHSLLKTHELDLEENWHWHHDHIERLHNALETLRKCEQELKNSGKIAEQIEDYALSLEIELTNLRKHLPTKEYQVSESARINHHLMQIDLLLSEELKHRIVVGGGEITPEQYQKRLEQLRVWADPSSQTAAILIKYWGATLEIKRSCNADVFDKVMRYSDGLPKFINFIQTEDELRRIGLFLVGNPRLSITLLSMTFFKDVDSKKKLFNKFREYENLVNDRRYWTIQGLNSMGFLCLHVANAFGGGTIGWTNSKEDPFRNIENDIKKSFDYNPSISVIHPKLRPFLVRSIRAGVHGSIGVIYDYGYIYEAYPSDISYSGRDVISRTGVARRTGKQEYRSEVALILTYPVNSDYNEFFIRNWTVSGIFYTRGCQQSVINRLKQLSDTLSFHKHLNGEYLFRGLKTGVPKYVEKIFPILEINPQNRRWKIVYVPKKRMLRKVA